MGKPPPPIPTLLPFSDVEEKHKDWLDPYRPGFITKIGKQGKSEDSAAEFVRADIIPKFYDFFFPTSTQPARDQAFDYVENVSTLGLLRQGLIMLHIIEVIPLPQQLPTWEW